MKYYKHIDALRALAVIAVLFVHLDFNLFSGGYVGVDVFFVISGFLITNIIVKEIDTTGKFDFVNFYTRRIRRIMPALIFVLIISFILGVWLLNLAKFQIFGGSFVAASLSFSNIFFYNQAGYFDAFSKSSPLLHTWSLGVEEQFYIFWPIILLVAYKFFKRTLLQVLIAVFAISFIMCLFYQNVKVEGLYYLVQYRAFEFCIGGFLVYVLRNEKFVNIRNFNKEILCLLGFIFIFYPIFSYGEKTFFPSYNALMPAIGAALLIYAGDAKYCGYILRNKAIGFIGLISYSLYLIHWPLIVFIKTFSSDIGDSFSLSFGTKIIIIFASIFIATLMYYLIEQPFRRNIPKERKDQKRLLLRWSFVLVIIVILGCSIFYSKGWLWRAKTPEALTNIENISNYRWQNWGGADFKFDDDYLYKGATPYPKVVMMGDSHSGMLDFGFINEIAIPQDMTTYTVAHRPTSALLLPGVSRISPGQQKLHDRIAVKAYTDVISELKKSDDSILIYSTWLSGQIKLAGYMGTDISIDINSLKTSKYTDYKPFTSALDRLVEDMQGRKLVLIGDFPGSLTYDSVDCVSRLKWFDDDSNCSSTDNINQNIAAVNVNKVLAQYASEHQNVYFINPYKIFCRDDYCMNIDENGTPLYSDNDYESNIKITNSHLSKTGSEYFFSKIKNQLLNIINGQKPQ